MSQIIILDSGPLGLLVQRPGVAPADRCREWIKWHLNAGTSVLVPEIVDYEVRRELLRIGKTAALAKLDAFESAIIGRYIPLTTTALRKAAELWADARQHGLPTASPHALDVDVILAAQVLTSGIPASTAIIASTNPAHLSRFTRAAEWSSI